MTKLDNLIFEVEMAEIAAECQALRLGDNDTRAILARHRRAPYLLDLVEAHGGAVRDFVRARLEIRRALAAPE